MWLGALLDPYKLRLSDVLYSFFDNANLNKFIPKILHQKAL